MTQDKTTDTLETTFHAVRGEGKTSALRKYQLLAVGNTRLTSLLAYELLTTTLTYLPGLVGVMLRKAFYPVLFKRMERAVVIGSGVSLRLPARVVLGRGTFIDDLASLSARGGEETEIVLGQGVFVGRGTVLNVRNGRIVLGDHSNLGGFCRLGCSKGTISLGQHVLVGALTYIGGGMHRFDRLDVPMALQGQVHKGGVTIEDDVWIGGGCQILDGVTIGKGSIIGAGSIVTKSIPPFSIAFGAPAKVYRKRTASEDLGAAPPDGDGELDEMEG